MEGLKYVCQVWLHVARLLCVLIQHFWFRASAFLSRRLGRDPAPTASYVESYMELLRNPEASPPAARQRQLTSPLSIRANSNPIVFVHGFGTPRTFTQPRTASLSGAVYFTPELGWYSSTHDRACDLFYALKGGTVDYGKDHSCNCGHPRFGKAHVGLYEDWDADHPVHIVAHSYGGNTARYLQHLLDIRFFPEHDTSGSWIRSIVCIASPLNGTTIIHALGLTENARALRWGSFLHIAWALVAIRAFLSRRMGWQRFVFNGDHLFSFGDLSTSLLIVIRTILFASHPLLVSRDNGHSDMAIEPCMKMNAKVKEHPATTYLSVPCVRSHAGPRTVRHWPDEGAEIDIVVLGTFAGAWVLRRRPYAEFRQEEWFENDGLVPVYSQLFPRGVLKEADVRRLGDIHHCNQQNKQVDKGVWQVCLVNRLMHRLSHTLSSDKGLDRTWNLLDVFAFCHRLADARCPGSGFARSASD